VTSWAQHHQRELHGRFQLVITFSQSVYCVVSICFIAAASVSIIDTFRLASSQLLFMLPSYGSSYFSPGMNRMHQGKGLMTHGSLDLTTVKTAECSLVECWWLVPPCHVSGITSSLSMVSVGYVDSVLLDDNGCSSNSMYHLLTVWVAAASLTIDARILSCQRCPMGQLPDGHVRC